MTAKPCSKAWIWSATSTSLRVRCSSAPSGRTSKVWETRVTPKAARLTQPRYPLLGLPEFGSAAALDHYHLRKRRALGDLVELRANTRSYIAELMPDLEQLDRMVETPLAINGMLSLDDVRVLPVLRSLAVVKGLRFPQRLRDYFESMMALVGHQPLPVA